MKMLKRDTKKAPFQWRKKMNTTEVYNIQEKCREALQLWGYRELKQGQKLTELESVVDLEHFQLSNP